MHEMRLFKSVCCFFFFFLFLFNVPTHAATTLQSLFYAHFIALYSQHFLYPTLLIQFTISFMFCLLFMCTILFLFLVKPLIRKSFIFMDFLKDNIQICQIISLSTSQQWSENCLKKINNKKRNFNELNLTQLTTFFLAISFLLLLFDIHEKKAVFYRCCYAIKIYFGFNKFNKLVSSYLFFLLFFLFGKRIKILFYFFLKIMVTLQNESMKDKKHQKIQDSLQIYYLLFYI